MGGFTSTGGIYFDAYNNQLNTNYGNHYTPTYSTGQINAVFRPDVMTVPDFFLSVITFFLLLASLSLFANRKTYN